MFFRGDLFLNFGYLIESRGSPISEFGISTKRLWGSIEVFSFLCIGNDLLTSMGANRILSEKLKKRFYTLIYSEGQESWGWEYLCFRKLLRVVQARKPQGEARQLIWEVNRPQGTRD